MEKTRQLDIIKHLKNKGFDTYLPGKHKGDCVSEYLVVKTGATSQVEKFSSEVTYYDIMCYVPEDTPSRLDALLDEVVQAMLEMAPMIRPTHESTGHFFEENIKAHTRSITYSNYKNPNIRR